MYVSGIAEVNYTSFYALYNYTAIKAVAPLFFFLTSTNNFHCWEHCLSDHQKRINQNAMDWKRPNRSTITDKGYQGNGLSKQFRAQKDLELGRRVSVCYPFSFLFFNHFDETLCYCCF